MGRRIDVELTSARDDGTWTWRAAGARQPKGTVDGALLHEGARVGDVVRAEADFEIDGIFITSVLTPKDKDRPGPRRLEVIGPPRDQRPVVSSLVPKQERPRTERPPRRQGDDAERRPRREDGRRRPQPDDANPGTRPDDAHRRPRPDDGERRPRQEDAERGPRRANAERRDRPGRPAGARHGTERPEPSSRRGERAARPERRPEAADTPTAPARPRRLSPGNVHRAGVLASLSPEQRPIAEQVLKGGIPAVRQAVEAQNAQLRSQQLPEVKAGPLVAMAEELLPRLKAAEWRDRAEAAAAAADEISIRDLRSVVASAVARDDETRLLASTLRAALERRLAEQRDRWLGEISGALDEGRLVRALRVAARPPDPTARLGSELALRLSEAAGAAMDAEATAERWLTLLEAVAESPVRRSVKPAALPAAGDANVLEVARQAAGRVPALAGLLGIDMPPPPGPPPRPRPGPRPGRPIPPPTRPSPPPVGAAAAPVDPVAEAAPPPVDALETAPPPVDPVAEAAPPPVDAVETAPPPVDPVAEAAPPPVDALETAAAAVDPVPEAASAPVDPVPEAAATAGAVGAGRPSAPDTAALERTGDTPR